jgi:hypothetical protein
LHVQHHALLWISGTATPFAYLDPHVPLFCSAPWCSVFPFRVEDGDGDGEMGNGRSTAPRESYPVEIISQSRGRWIVVVMWVLLLLKYSLPGMRSASDGSTARRALSRLDASGWLVVVVVSMRGPTQVGHPRQCPAAESMTSRCVSSENIEAY